ncbi:MAG: dethiobiotin synthase [Candidatus Omnitrophica bacterium]|nr:dethiobiotin synthase [Candidatus Omnitrophota bacterium]MBI5144815.1 dethiobiotin synthase [Candidatus Omnitrophota bacterium]
MNGIFITGTDTGVGKTIVTGLLARYLLEKGYNVITQKWIQTGSTSTLSPDVKLHLKIMQRNKNDIRDYLDLVSPYTFKLASSPHLASRIEKRKITPHKIISSFKFLSSKFDFVIVEGIGGALVPYSKKSLIIDIVKELDLSVLLVAQNKLGAINHTLLTIEALASRNIRVLGIVFNNLKKQTKQILKDNPLIVRTLTNQQIFGSLPWVDGYDKLYEKFIPMGEKIRKALCR